ncbi:MAG: hypothetical protein KAQ68_10945, partial [Clostridiales bacterium]|nr:hypothetical protein [Clostridiales bacterium]
MKYQIDTIPVWDAIKENSECPFCLIQKNLEDKYVDFYLSDAIMQSHIRIRINETGFCARHYNKMLHSDRKLSLGLTTTTHMDTILKSSQKAMDTLTKDKTDTKKENAAIDALLSQINDTSNTCVVCEDIARDMERYIYTYIHLY